MEDLDFDSLMNLESTSGDVNLETGYQSQPTPVSSQLDTFSKETEDINSGYSTIKQKIFFTNDLIRMYQTCKKQLEETTEQLNQSRKDNSLIQAQLQLLLSKEEPSYTENVKLKGEVKELKITLNNLKAELHGMDESRRMHEETIKVLKAEGSGIVLEMKKKHKQQIAELREALAEKSSANRKLTQSKKQLQQTISRLRQKKKSKSAQNGGFENSVINTQSISEAHSPNNSDLYFAVPNEKNDSRIAPAQNGILETANNLQDSVFESSNLSERDVRKEPLKARVAYITSTTDDSADESQPNKPRHRNSADTHLHNSQAITDVTPLSASKQKTLKNRMMDIKRKRAYSSFKRCPTQPQLADLLSLAEGWRAIVTKRPLVRKATAIDKLKTLVSEYCEKHYLGSNEKLVLTKLCKLHKAIFSKKHKNWLEEVLQTAAGSDISSVDSKHSSASETEANPTTIYQNKEISTRRDIMSLNLDKSENIRGNVTDHQTECAILPEKNLDNHPPSKQQNNKPALLSISSQDSLDSDKDHDMEITDITNEHPVEFISEMPDISNVTVPRVEGNEIDITIAIKDTDDTPNIEVESKNTELNETQKTNEFSQQKDNIVSSVIEEDNSKNIGNVEEISDKNKLDTVEKGASDFSSDLDNFDVYANGRMQIEVLSESIDQMSEPQVGNDIGHNKAQSIHPHSNETTEDNPEMIDANYLLPGHTKRVSRFVTKEKNLHVNKKVKDGHLIKPTSEDVSNSDASLGERPKHVSQTDSKKKNYLANKKGKDKWLEDSPDNVSNSDTLCEQSKGVPGVEVEKKNDLDERKAIDIVSNSESSSNESFTVKNTNSDSILQMPDTNHLSFQKQTLKSNLMDDSDTDTKTQCVDLADDIRNRSSDKNDFISQMPDIGNLLPDPGEKSDSIVLGNVPSGKDCVPLSSRKRNASEDQVRADQLPKKQAKFQEPKVLPVANRRRTRSMTADSSSDQEFMQNVPQSPIRRSRRISNRSRTSSESSENNEKSLNKIVKSIKKTKGVTKQKSKDAVKASDKKPIQLSTHDKKKYSEQTIIFRNLDMPLQQTVLCSAVPTDSNKIDDIINPDSDISGLNLIDEFLDSPLSSSDDEISDASVPFQMKSVNIKYSITEKIFKKMNYIGDAISPFPSSPIMEDDVQRDIRVIESESSEEMDLGDVAYAVEDSIVLKNIVEHDTHEPTKGRNSISPSTDLCTALSFGTPKNDLMKHKNSLSVENTTVEKDETMLPCSPSDNLSTASSEEELLPSDIPSTSTAFNFASGSVANDILKPRRFSCEAPEKAVTVLPIKPAVKSVSVDVVQPSLTVSKNRDLRKSLSLPLHREESDIPSHWHASLPHYNIDQSKNIHSSEELSSINQLEINTDNEKDDQAVSSNQENFSDKENVDENVETPSDFDADTWLSRMSNIMSPLLTTIDSESDACTDQIIKNQKTEEKICHHVAETTDAAFDDKVEEVTEDEGQGDTETQDKEQHNAETDASIVSMHSEPNYPSTEDECDLIMDVSDGEERQKTRKKSLTTRRSAFDKSSTKMDSKQKMDENDNNVVDNQTSHNVRSDTLSGEQRLSQKIGVEMIVCAENSSENGASGAATPKKQSVSSDNSVSENKKTKKVKSKQSKQEVEPTACKIADLPRETLLENAVTLSNDSHGADDVSVTDPAFSSRLQQSQSNKAQNNETVIESSLPAENYEQVNADKENMSSVKKKKNFIKLKPFKRKKTSSRGSIATVFPFSESEKLTIKGIQDVNTLIMKHRRNEKVDVRFEDYFLPRCIARFLWHSRNEFDIFSKMDVNIAGKSSATELPEHEREFVCQMGLIQNTGIYDGCFVTKMVLPCILRIFKNFGYGTPFPFDNQSIEDKGNLYAELQHLMPPNEKNSLLTLAKSCALIRVFGMLCKIANSLSSLCSLCCYCLKWHKSFVLFPLIQALLCWPDAFKAYPTLGKLIFRTLRKQIDHRMIIGNRAKAQSMEHQMDWLDSKCGWKTVVPSATASINHESLHDAISRIKSAKFSKEFETFMLCEANGVEQFTLPIPVFDPETMIGMYTFELLPKEGVVEKVKQEVLDAQFWPVLNSWSQHLHVHGNTEEGKEVSDTAVSASLDALSRIFSSYMMRQRYSHKAQTTTPQLQTHFKVICSLMEHLSTMYFHKAPRLVQCATASFLIRTAFCNPPNAYQSLLIWVKASSTPETAKRHKNLLLLTAMSGCSEQTVKNICTWLDSACGSLGDGLVSRLWPS